MPVARKIMVKTIVGASKLPGSACAANPYVGCAHACRYCYAAYMKRFTSHREPWGAFVDVKIWPAIKNSAKYAGKKIFISSVTDPYQEAEKTHERTRALLTELAGSGCRPVIATKSDLIVRDSDLISAFPQAQVLFSLNTLDPAFQRLMERAPAVERRLAAMRALKEAGVRIACFIAPVFPEITEVFAILERVAPLCDTVLLDRLNLRGDYRHAVLGAVRKFRPDLWPLYERMFLRGDDAWWRDLDRSLRRFALANGILYGKEADAGREEGLRAIINYSLARRR